MAGTAQNVDIGPCWIKYGTTDLGYTKGGVKVTVEPTIEEIEVDQETEPIDSRITKRNVQVTVPLAEYTLENLHLAFPGSEIVTDNTTPTKKKLVLKSAAGVSLVSAAQELVLHPTDKLPADVSEDWTFPKAVPVGNVEVSYDKENPKIIELTFRAFPDATGVSGIFGDKTASAV